MRTFSERLKSAMEEVNLKQSALAAMVGVSKGAMSGYVSGKVNPPEKKKEQIALALGKSADYFRVLDVNTEIVADGGLPDARRAGRFSDGAGCENGSERPSERGTSLWVCH